MLGKQGKVRTFSYPAAQRMHLLYNVYVFALVVPFLVVWQALPVGWGRYVVMGIIDATALVIVAYLDNRPGNSWPTTIRIDGNTVVLSRLWEYDRFDLSDIHWVEAPIYLYKRFCFLGSTFTRVEYQSGGINHVMGVNVHIDGYDELLDLFSSYSGVFRL